MRYVAMDFETGNGNMLSACALGISVFEDDVHVRDAAWLIRPPEEVGDFHYFNVKIHGIRKEMLVNAPSFNELWVGELVNLLRGSIIVCHNAMFDTAVLCACLAHYRLPMPDCAYVCTVKISQRVWPALENHKLNTVSDALGISLNHHEAGSDAHACALILQHALLQTGCADISALAHKIGMRLGRICSAGKTGCSIARKRAVL